MKTATHQFSRYVSVPHDEGVRVDQAIIIKRPVAEVYSFWRRLDNLPCFMRHVESVTVQDDLHSHWAIRALGGKIVEWDAEIIEQRDNEMISWRSTPVADVDNAGSVWFTELPGGQATLVRVELKYVPPAGKAGAFISKIFGRDADAEIQEDLWRLKAFLETGQLPVDSHGMWRRTASKVSNAAKAADNCVRDHAWTAAASAAACGFAVGFLLAWRLVSARR